MSIFPRSIVIIWLAAEWPDANLDVHMQHICGWEWRATKRSIQSTEHPVITDNWLFSIQQKGHAIAKVIKDVKAGVGRERNPMKEYWPLFPGERGQERWSMCCSEWEEGLLSHRVCWTFRQARTRRLFQWIKSSWCNLESSQDGKFSACKQRSCIHVSISKSMAGIVHLKIHV